MQGRHDTQNNDSWHNDIGENDTQHNDTQHNGLICDTQHRRHLAYEMLWCVSLCWVSCFIYCYADCHYSECHVLFIVMLNGIMVNFIVLNVIILSVIMLNVFMLNIVAPFAGEHGIIKIFTAVVVVSKISSTHVSSILINGGTLCLLLYALPMCGSTLGLIQTGKSCKVIINNLNFLNKRSIL